MTRTTGRGAALLLTGALLGAPAHAAPQAPAAPAPARPPSGGLFSSNGGPIGMSADGMERFQTEGRTVYTGNVDVVQDQARLRTPKLTLFSSRRPGAPTPGPGASTNDFGSIERIEAEGPVYYITPTEQVKGDHGTYLAADDTITVTGNVTLVQGKDVLHGDKLVIEQKTGRSVITTQRPGKGPERVRGVFFPNPPNGTGPSASKPGV